MDDIEPKKVEKFVKEVMQTERRYSAEQKNQKSSRLSEIRDCLDKFIIRELPNEDK